MYNIRDHIGLRPAVGDVGIEIEMEGDQPFPKPTRNSVWKSTEDGSLRGYSIEYVTKTPVDLGDVNTHLKWLREFIKGFGVNPIKGFRAGVHVHVNVQEMTPEEVFKMGLIYLCMEAPLIKFCGDGRKGNLFCLGMTESSYHISLLLRALEDKNLAILRTDQIRYASINFNSLFKYGSLEFRAMESNPDFSKIEEWCKILCSIREAAKKLEQPEQIPMEISAGGATSWAQNILGKELMELIWYDEFDNDVRNNMRHLQRIIYSKHWS